MSAVRVRELAVQVAVLVALLSAFCFALAAALQHREALTVAGTGVADVRLLGRLGRRPLWWAGVGCDVASMVLHVVALSLATLAVVQPLGVMGIVFAVPLAALLRRQHLRSADLAAVVAVAVGLVALLRCLPSSPELRVPSAAVILASTVAVLVLMVTATMFAHFRPGRIRPILLAMAAGAAFGLTASLVRVLILLARRPGTGPTIVVAAVCIVVLGLSGYLLLQSAYRSGHFAASLATSTVFNPVVAVLAGGVLLGEPLPTDPIQLTVIAAAGVLVCGGIARLVRSPAALNLAPPSCPNPDAAARTGAQPFPVPAAFDGPQAKNR